MTGTTHVAFAEFIYLLVLTTTGVSLNPVNAAVIAISSLLPDIDTAASLAGKCAPFISLRIERKFGHRTITHSINFIMLLAAVAFPLCLLNRDLYVCIFAGYASHPFLDTMTVNGVKLFYPFSPAKCVFPLEVNNPHRYRVRTGGRMDRALGIIFLLGCVPTFIVAYQGYERFIRAAQQDIEAGVRDYGEISRDHLVLASVNGYSMLTKQTFQGTVEIVGALNPHTLVFKGTDRRLHTMGKDFQADFVVRSILCARGAAAVSQISNIDVSNRLLAEMISSLDTSAEHYLFGDLSTSDRVSLPENIRVFTPISGAAGLIKFNYATSGDIRAYNLENIFVTKGVLTVKTIVVGRAALPDTIPEGLHRLKNYVRVTSLSERRDSMIVLKMRGDTVGENEVICRKAVARLFREQAAFLEEKIRVLSDRSVAAASGFEARIGEARQAARIDSAEYNNASELLRNGFISQDVLRMLQKKSLRSGRILSELAASKAAAAAKTALEIRGLNLTMKELEAKAAGAKRESEIRSPVNGILFDIRRLPRNDKEELVFIIQRLR